MFDLKDAYSNVKLEDIYRNTTEYQLWKQYCKNFEDIDVSFKSEFYNDRNPSCRIYTSSNNRLRYKDFGTGDNFSVIEYIQKKYNCTFTECINIIANDLNISNIKGTIINPKPLIQQEDIITVKKKTYIDIIPQPFNITDYNYWSQYKIPLTLLDEYNVYSCKNVILRKGDKETIFEYSNSNPIYAYKFIEDGEIYYKIYFPLANKKYKWLFNGNSSVIEGYDQLDLSNEVLILTKSLKDCMCYRLLNYNAISLQGETNRLGNDIIKKLYKRFDNIIVNYDNDEEGMRGALRLKTQHNLNYFFIDDEKDISDYIRKNGLRNAKKLVDGKVNKNLI